MKNKNNETLKAGCVVKNDSGEILLVSANDKKIWSFPKGHGEKGETIKGAALREVKEETGWDVELIKQLSDITYIHGQTRELIRVAIFLAKPIKKTGAPETKTYAKWFSLAEAKKIIYPNLAFILNEI